MIDHMIIDIPGSGSSLDWEMGGVAAAISFPVESSVDLFTF